jgi:NadR type nicotinamide-nucleotide adenylyltransferase
MSKQVEQVLKIVVIGPESTGKSTLCAALASHFSTTWCREYAREYLLTNGKEYSYDDLLLIAKGQLQLEDLAVQEAVELKQPASMASEEQPILFIDTDMQVMKVWCEFVFGRCHQEILDQILERQYDGYLLCKPDLPWVKDELREYPDPETRNTLYHIYRDILINQSVPWFEVSGTDPARTNAAIHWVEQLQLKGSAVFGEGLH